MGEAVGERGRLMGSGPSRSAEAVVSLLVPPACREEVLGDLYERYCSPRQYFLEAARTMPLVILSRIRRTADPQVLVIQAFALYMSYLGAAWLRDGALPQEPWRLLQLAVPAGMALLGLVLEDAYAIRGRRAPMGLARGPLVGLGLALVSQGVLWAGKPDWTVPRGILLNGCAMSLLLSSAVRMLFPPAADQLQGVNAPAHWLKQAHEPPGNRLGHSRAGAIAGVLIVLLVAYRLWKRG